MIVTKYIYSFEKEGKMIADTGDLSEMQRRYVSRVSL